MKEETQRITSLVFYGAVVLIAVLAFRIVEPFLMQIGWAVVLAICVAPLQARLSRRFGPLRSAAFLTLMVILLLVVPLLLVVRTLLHEGANAVQYVQVHLADRGGPLGLFQAAWQWLRQRLPFLPEEQSIVQQLSQRLGGLAGLAASRAGQVVKEVLEFLFNLVITLSIFFFVVKDGPQMAKLVRRLLPFGAEQNTHLLVLVRDIVSTSVTSTLVIAIVQGIVGGIAFFAVGIPGPLLWGCLMSVMALLPVVGSTLIWAPAALWLALSGSLVKGIVICRRGRAHPGQRGQRGAAAHALGHRAPEHADADHQPAGRGERLRLHRRRAGAGGGGGAHRLRQDVRPGA